MKSEKRKAEGFSRCEPVHGYERKRFLMAKLAETIDRASGVMSDLWNSAVQKKMETMMRHIEMCHIERIY